MFSRIIISFRTHSEEVSKLSRASARCQKLHHCDGQDQIGAFCFFGNKYKLQVPEARRITEGGRGEGEEEGEGGREGGGRGDGRGGGPGNVEGCSAPAATLTPTLKL